MCLNNLHELVYSWMFYRGLSMFSVLIIIVQCRFGPLRHQWCMRFEAKNHYIKRLVGLNFKNIPKSVATRHQYYMCLRQLSPPGMSTNFLYIGDKIGKGITVHVVYLYTYMYTYNVHIIVHIMQLYGCYMYNHRCIHDC